MIDLTAAGIAHVTAFFDMSLFATFGLPQTLGRSEAPVSAGP